MYFSSKMLQVVKEIFEVSWYTLSIKLVFFLVTKKKKKNHSGYTERDKIKTVKCENVDANRNLEND